MRRQDGDELGVEEPKTPLKEEAENKGGLDKSSLTFSDGLNDVLSEKYVKQVSTF